MDQAIFDQLLKNYLDLRDRVDAHTGQALARIEDQMACKKGCDSCCRSISLFPVEAFALSRAFFDLAEETRDRISATIHPFAQEEAPCPLLVDRACILYSDRPIICRTHGFPIYIEKDGEALVDFCPENFKTLTSFPNEALIRLEQLNTVLAAVNTHFLSQIEADLPDGFPCFRP